ncbi:MAG: glycosyltransferase [Phormidesmis sp.]
MASIEREPSQVSNRMMLFELSIYGHHSTYIQHLVRYWCENTLSGCFYLVVASQFMEKHADVVSIAEQYPDANVFFLPLSETEEASLTANTSNFFYRKARAWQEWNLMCAYASKWQVSHCFLDSFDFFQWPFLLSKKPPCPISGIYFKPTFHYSTFATHVATPKTYAQQWQEKLTLAAIFRQPSLHRLFCIDPFAVDALNSSFAQGKAVSLADPISTYPAQSKSSELREQLKIDESRKVFLLFGDLTSRKGVDQLLEAITQLPTSLCHQLCVLLVGRCSSSVKLSLQPKINQIRQNQSVQIIEHYEFVSEQAVQDYFQLADVVLAPYQKHIGMSGILLQAAAARKPVLSSNYGLMGELVYRYQLGLAVDSTQPSELAKGLSQLLRKPLAQFYSSAKMEQLVQQNTIEKFAGTIFDELSIQL